MRSVTFRWVGPMVAGLLVAGAAIFATADSARGNDPDCNSQCWNMETSELCVYSEFPTTCVSTALCGRPDWKCCTGDCGPD